MPLNTIQIQIFVLSGIFTPFDECTYWADVVVSGNRLEVQERAQHFVDILKPMKDAFSNLPRTPLGE